MSELRFEASEDGKQVHALVLKLEPESLTAEFLRNQFLLTEFRQYFLHENAFLKLISIYKSKSSEADPETGLLEPVDVIVAEQRDALLSVDIASDRMSCAVTVETAYGGKNPGTEELQRQLKSAGVVKGIHDVMLNALAAKLQNVPAGTVLKETVAEGKPSGQSRQAKLELLVTPIQDRLMKPQLRGDGTVDMHDFGEIEMVETGAPLMRRIPPVVGEPGYNVQGELVSAQKPEDRDLVAGEGAEISADDRNLLVAARRGVALKVEGGMMVSDAYCVGDVDLNTGNIDFDGTVVVKGSVKEGMQVKATGKVLIRDYVESATVQAGDEVVIGKGILGRQKAQDQGEQLSVLVETPATVFANYIQYAHIVAGEQVTASKHIMHSDVQGSEIVVESPKKTEGKIIGGVIRPTSRLLCNTLGGPSYIATNVDFSVRFSEQLTTLGQIREEIGERLNVVRGMKEALRRIEDKQAGAAVKEQVSKITNTIAHFETLIKELKSKRAALITEVNEIAETLEIQVNRALFPGVNITFIQNDVPVKQERDGCRIKSKDDGITYFTLS